MTTFISGLKELRERDGVLTCHTLDTERTERGWTKLTCSGNYGFISLIYLTSRFPILFNIFLLFIFSTSTMICYDHTKLKLLFMLPAIFQKKKIFIKTFFPLNFNSLSFIYLFYLDFSPMFSEGCKINHSDLQLL